eukprot:gene3729-4298_t
MYQVHTAQLDPAALSKLNPNNNVMANGNGNGGASAMQMLDQQNFNIGVGGSPTDGLVANNNNTGASLQMPIGNNNNNNNNTMFGSPMTYQQTNSAVPTPPPVAHINQANNPYSPPPMQHLQSPAINPMITQQQNSPLSPQPGTPLTNSAIVQQSNSPNHNNSAVIIAVQVIGHQQWGNTAQDVRINIYFVSELLRGRWKVGPMRRQAFYQGMVSNAPSYLTLPRINKNSYHGSAKLYIIEAGCVFTQYLLGETLPVYSMCGAKVTPVDSYEAFIDYLLNIFVK